jgi:hypothetical protein
MNMMALLTMLAVFSGTAMAADKASPPSTADMGRELREQILLSQPADLGIKPTKEYPRVWGVVMDWPLANGTASVVALCDGNASLYTTGSFGVLGGIGHSEVRQAATVLVRDADSFHSEARSTADRSYPKAGRVRFYLLTFGGLRVLEADLKSIQAGKDRYSTLFDRAQDVITQLRLVVQKRH